MSNSVKHTDKKAIQALIQALEKLEVDEVVISPGSRSAPLIQELSCYPAIGKTVIFDERSAAYFALGIAQQTNRIVALVCTSGTALLNYAPAICEAYYQQLPLLILTADRPAAMLNKGENQTINQEGIYKNYIKASYSLLDENFDFGLLLKTLETPQGPVHINIPLKEPLYNTTTEVDIELKINTTIFPLPTFSKEKKEEFIKLWSTYHKKWIVCGKANLNSEREKWLNELEKSEDTIILAEPLSNCTTKNSIKNVDGFIASMALDDEPQLIVTIGRQILSKRLRTFLKNSPQTQHWHVCTDSEQWDIFDNLIDTIICHEVDFLKTIASVHPKKNSYQSDLISKNERAKMITSQHGSEEWSDFLILKKLSESIEENSIIQWGNSSVIRYASFFEYKKSVQHFANRGTSGIDGCLSTAVGCAFAQPDKKVYAVLGDISFFYDSNALFIKPFPQNLKIIVINNGGGGIFRLIEGQQDETLMQTYFETSHSHQTSHFASMFGLPYYFCEQLEQIEDTLHSFFSIENKACLLELKTEADKNVFTYKSYFKKIKQ
jgi:2-succinyl-5-enolpyruvyl-6-hydroxy-3-cyclohexene-1-carboxylate synthase